MRKWDIPRHAKECPRSMTPVAPSQPTFLSCDCPGIVNLKGNSQSTPRKEEKKSSVGYVLAFRPPGRGIPQMVVILLISALLLVPCVWLPQIESFDLCSHIYNAWL